VDVDLLDIVLTKPLEREFEGWTMACIEQYFARIGKVVAICAIGTKTENAWGADEAVGFDRKIIGLQFKRPDLASRAKASRRCEWRRLKWILAEGKAPHRDKQIRLVMKHREIFYALPTFVNRRYRHAALEHCLFWRPHASADLNAWYYNPNVRTPHAKVACDGIRWGELVERAGACLIGKRVDRGLKITHAWPELESIREQYRDGDKEGEEGDGGSGLYLIAIPV
jgi:hypothetical protein